MGERFKKKKKLSPEYIAIRRLLPERAERTAGAGAPHRLVLDVKAEKAAPPKEGTLLG